MSIDIEQLAGSVETAKGLPTVTGRVDYEAEGYTAYGVWTLAMQTLKALGYTDTGVTSQVFYNMARQGVINGVKKATRFTEDEVESFVPRYVKTYITRNAK